MKVCIVIPNYNHRGIKDLLLKLELYHLPCIIVDDGSACEIEQELINAAKQFHWVHLITLKHNQGKGAAVLAGLAYAATQNYTHAIQIDADGQHDTNDITKFLAAIAINPEALIAGQPIYDPSIPKARLYGRKITNFWVYLETLSDDIKDTMCGYRAYPLTKTLQVVMRHCISKRMGFDIEIMVRLYWAKTAIIFIPTKVTYPSRGISHFRLWQDNLEISWVHTCLFFGMLRRLPQILQRKISTNNHWSQAREKGSLLGMNIVLCSYKFLGKKLTYLLLYPIVAYFYCFSPLARKASKKYLAKLAYRASSFKHLLAFAESIVDKLAVWHGDISLEQIEIVGIELFRKQVAEKTGGVIFTAHLGNMEIARALSDFDLSVKINALLFTSNAKKITTFLEKINPKFTANLLYLENLGLAQAIDLQTKIDNGEFIVIAGDRTSVTKPQNSIPAVFFGDRAYFPTGPFILAGLLRCPVFFMLCLKEKQNSFKIVFKEFASKIDISKTNRNQQLQQHAQQYAHLLEEYCRLYPLQWFNFFDFWKSYEE